MSKIKIKQEIRIECASEQEVKEIMKKMRGKGFHSSDIIHLNWCTGKYTVTMYSKFKKYT